MADLVLTATSVVAGADSVQESGTFGATVTAGQLVYKEAATKTWKLFDSNSATAEVRQVTGIALNGGGSGQPCRIHKSGDITIGATITAGLAYYGSDTPGGICPVADIGSGEYVNLVGVAKSTTVLTVNFMFPNVAL